jgi:hypothetical protein
MGREAGPGRSKSRLGVGIACRHHWIIDPPGGPTSRALCKHCGTVSEFQNYVQQPVYEEGGLGRQSAARKKAWNEL